MSGEMSGEPPRDLTVKEKFDRWMVNEGYRRLFVFIFGAVHAMIFAFGFMNYDLKDNLTTARATFGITYPIARAAALVLHFDIAFILFRGSPAPRKKLEERLTRSSGKQNADISGKTNTSQWNHPIW